MSSLIPSHDYGPAWTDEDQARLIKECKQALAKLLREPDVSMAMFDQLCGLPARGIDGRRGDGIQDKLNHPGQAISHLEGELIAWAERD